MSSVGDKRTSLEYGYRPSVFPEKSYQDFVRIIPEAFVNNQTILKIPEVQKFADRQKDNEFKQLSQADSYQGTINKYSGFDGFKGSGEAALLVDKAAEAVGGVNCVALDHYCAGMTVVVPFDCKGKCFSVYFAQHGVVGEEGLPPLTEDRKTIIKSNSNQTGDFIIDAKCNEITITAPANEKDPLYFMVMGQGGTATYLEVLGETCMSCGTTSIGYTTQQMAGSEAQTLTVVDAVAGTIYDWVITAGGGSLNVAVGTSVVYTAPATNVNCSNNPTIAMSVLGVICDTLEIAVNTSASVANAYQHVAGCISSCHLSVPGYICQFDDPGYAGMYAFACATETMYCNGTFKAWVTIFSGANMPIGSCNNFYGQHCNLTPSFLDLRTDAMKTDGCCPAELL